MTSTETSPGFSTNLWVVVTPGHTYGPFRTEGEAAGTPVAKHSPAADVRLMTEADSAAISAQEAEWDRLRRGY